MISAPPPLAPSPAHERVRKLLLSHLRVLDRAAEEQADEPLRQACADFAKAIAGLPVEDADRANR